jgi:hypothetical protein
MWVDTRVMPLRGHRCAKGLLRMPISGSPSLPNNRPKRHSLYHGRPESRPCHPKKGQPRLGLRRLLLPLRQWQRHGPRVPWVRVLTSCPNCCPTSHYQPSQPSRSCRAVHGHRDAQHPFSQVFTQRSPRRVFAATLLESGNGLPLFSLARALHPSARAANTLERRGCHESGSKRIRYS